MSGQERLPPNLMIHLLTQIEGMPDAIAKYSRMLGIYNLNIVPIGYKDGVDKVDPVLLSNVEIVVADCELLTQFYKKMPLLKWAHSTWAGVEVLFNCIKEEPPFKITRHGGEEFCILMAEFVMSQVLICERQFPTMWKNQMLKKWQPINHYRSLKELTISILGVGNMGRAIAQFFSERGACVLGFARSTRESGKLFHVISARLEYVLGEADYVVNTLPSTKNTCGILNSKFHHCTKRPVFINVGRGDIVDECQLVAALKSGHLRGAVLDVFSSEPLSPDSELWEIPQVIITPHCAAVSRCDHVAQMFVLELHKYLYRKSFINQVDWTTGY